MILCICLNPALQRTLFFSSLQWNNVNRAVKTQWTGGGKGVNVGRIIHQLNHDVLVLLPAGGWTGNQLEHILKKEKIPSYIIQTQQSTRICETLINTPDSSYTEIVQESEIFTDKEVESVLKCVDQYIERADFVVLSGTVPGGFDPGIYQQFVHKVQDKGKKAIVDATGCQLIKAISAQPWLIKPNWHEVEHTFKCTLHTNTEMLKTMAVMSEQGANNVLVTRSGPEAILLHNNQAYILKSPELHVVNPIGSGDAFTAGVAVRYCRTQDFLDAVKFGMACAGANVLTSLAGHVSLSDVKKIYSQIICESVGF